MLKTSKKIKEIYEEIQKKIFNVVPEKWDELYLYASIIDRLGEVQTGEMYFYFMPKGFLRRKFINVYEVPDKYGIEEEEYMKAVKSLYNSIKMLREEVSKQNKKKWSNITISIKNSRFKVEYNYDKLLGYQEEYYDHHIFWRKKYLNIEPHGKKEKIAIEQYVANRQTSRKKDEEYDTGIYQKIQPKVITYDTSDKKEYIIISNIEVLKNTENLKRIFSLQNELELLEEKIVVGIGEGNTIFQAEKNARISLKLSLNKNGKIFYSNGEKIKGPLYSSKELEYKKVSSKRMKKIADEIGINSSYLEKIKGIMCKKKKDEFTSSEIAEILNITQRSTNRILKKIIEKDYAESVQVENSVGVGRPKRIIKFKIN